MTESRRGQEEQVGLVGQVGQVGQARGFGIGPTLIAACATSVALTAQSSYVPARYVDGGLPQIPFQAVGGGEVLLELTVGTNGAVSDVRPLRVTPPFTDGMIEAARRWRFIPAEQELEAAAGAPDAPSPRTVESKVLVAGMFRPPTLNAPTLGVLPVDVAPAFVETPVPTFAVMPPYPPLARDSGVVLVEVRVDARGTVAAARVVRASPPFDEAALEAARQWAFRPALVNGASVETLAYIVFAFRQPVTLPATVSRAARPQSRRSQSGG